VALDPARTPLAATVFKREFLGFRPGADGSGANVREDRFNVEGAGNAAGDLEESRVDRRLLQTASPVATASPLDQFGERVAELFRVSCGKPSLPLEAPVHMSLTNKDLVRRGASAASPEALEARPGADDKSRLAVARPKATLIELDPRSASLSQSGSEHGVLPQP
jgi:hypothetical protein